MLTSKTSMIVAVCVIVTHLVTVSADWVQLPILDRSDGGSQHTWSTRRRVTNKNPSLLPQQFFQHTTSSPHVGQTTPITKPLQPATMDLSMNREKLDVTPTSNQIQDPPRSTSQFQVSSIKNFTEALSKSSTTLHSKEKLKELENDIGWDRFSFAEHPMEVLRSVHQTLRLQTPHSLIGKVRFLQGLKDHLLLYAEKFMKQLFPPQQESQARQSMGSFSFPSLQGSLMSMSFLMFGVFLINLVQQVITAQLEQDLSSRTI
ncbi:unnamed protein product [Timema podura]|uniref:Uncharacterized protein n=1 Tax=Timema podura TaxID=61482 RepID=A0ABN7NC51_TIMPD|nr:unnamed protein product [Timema podura]